MMDDAVVSLVGASRVLRGGANDVDPAAAFYGELVPQLLSDVARGDGTSRLMGFRATLDDGSCWQFLGIETKGTAGIPSGMMGLRLGATSGEVVGRSGMDEPFRVLWRWLDVSGARGVGEFEAAFVPEVPGGCVFKMTTNAYVGMPGAAAADDAIALVDYDPSWPERFDAMARWLRDMLPGVAGRIVHYGSTSVPGIPAKPVIDILLEVPSFEAARGCLITALNREDWEYWWYADHMIFIKRDRLMGVRTHHVHIAPPGHRLWEGVAFRDYLVAHPEVACEYVRLKQDLAVRFRTDREQYTEAKTAFIRSVTDRAMSA